MADVSNVAGQTGGPGPPNALRRAVLASTIGTSIECAVLGFGATVLIADRSKADITTEYDQPQAQSGAHTEKPFVSGG
jgi:hypothetical protein